LLQGEKNKGPADAQVPRFRYPGLTPVPSYAMAAIYAIYPVNPEPTRWWFPPSYKWVTIPLTIDISPINHSYWTYLHQLSDSELGHKPRSHFFMNIRWFMLLPCEIAGTEEDWVQRMTAASIRMFCVE